MLLVFLVLNLSTSGTTSVLHLLNLQEKAIKERHKNMSWAQRLKRVFGIDISTCSQCGGTVRIVACIENPVIIRKILDHLDKKQIAPIPFQLPLTRASPQPGLF